MEAKNAFFLDTSTQINKSWEDDPIRKAVQEDLEKKDCFCSLYVGNQYKLKIVNEAILLHTLVVRADTVEEALQRADSIRNRGDLPYKILRRFLKECSSKKPVLRRLRMLIEGTWRNHFLGNINQELFNITDCKLANENAVKRGDNYLSISKKCPIDCGICEFWNNRKSELQLLKTIDVSSLNKITDPKATLTKIKETADKVSDGESPHGDRCKTVSDVVIALEARDSKADIILHSMDSDFKLIGSIFKLPVYYFNKNTLQAEVQQVG